MTLQAMQAKTAELLAQKQDCTCSGLLHCCRNAPFCEGILVELVVPVVGVKHPVQDGLHLCLREHAAAERRPGQASKSTQSVHVWALHSDRRQQAPHLCTLWLSRVSLKKAKLRSMVSRCPTEASCTSLTRPNSTDSRSSSNPHACMRSRSL